MRPLYVRGDYHVCPNPLSADSYSVCQYNCRYCFVRQMYKGVMKKTYVKGLQPTDLNVMQNLLKRAFGSEKETTNQTVLSLRAGLPVIIGRKSEPLCPAEEHYHNTKKMIDMLYDYGVDAIPECKGTTKDLSVIKHAAGVLVSITPVPQKILEKLEPGLPSMAERFQFVKKLKYTGIFVGITGEPLFPLADKSFFDDYAICAREAKADHVNFGEYRAHNPKLTYYSFKEIGLDFKRIMKDLKIGWEGLGQSFADSIRSVDIKCSSPDWVNFGFSNDCEGCCGLDQFGVQHFTFQGAIQILKEKEKVYFKDLEKKNIFGEKYVEHFRNIWNNTKIYYNLSDIDGVQVVGKDDDDNLIYGRNKKNVFESFR